MKKDPQQRQELRKAKREARRIANEPPRRPVLEEIGNAVTHGVGALMAIAGLILLLLRSNTTVKTLSALVYGVCMLLMFLMSCLYHAFRGGSRVKRLWRRFDYCSIYLLIGGTFTPILLVYLGGTLGTWLCIAQWILIAAGISLIGVFGPSWNKWVHYTLYILMGWSALIFLPEMYRRTPPLLWLILLGGVIYTLGTIPFALKRKGSHFIWHFFVLAGAALHWYGIYQYVYTLT